MQDPFWHPAKAAIAPRHMDLCAALDATESALKSRDYVEADRIRNCVYGSGEMMAWFVADQIGMKMAHARDADRRTGVAQLKEFAA